MSLGRRGADIHAAAEHGISGSGGSLPHLAAIQASFGHHDVSGIQAHADSNAAEGARAMGAEAYATGSHVAFGNGSPSLFTAAHEAAHVVQQRGGVQLKGGVGQVGDAYEQHADAVAERVVQGKSAVDLLDGQIEAPAVQAKAACNECGGAPAGTGDCPACKATQSLGAQPSASLTSTAAPVVQRSCDPSVSSCPLENSGWRLSRTRVGLSRTRVGPTRRRCRRMATRPRRRRAPRPRRTRPRSPLGSARRVTAHSNSGIRCNRP